MKINKTIAVAVLLFGLLVGGLGAGVLLSQRPHSASAAPVAQQAATCTDDDDVQHEAEGEEDDATEDAVCDENEINEADEASDIDDVQEEHEDQADDVGEANEVDEADEAAVLQSQAGITADEAQAKVEAANPDAKTLTVELDNENGKVIYEVELDNGHDVKVDAANGNILGTALRDSD